MTNIKNGRYRMLNEEGQYEVVHFETNLQMVVGLDGKVAEIEGSIADRYTKEETDGFFQSVGTEIDAVEEIANGLNTRLTTVEGDVAGLQTGLANEIARATGVEGILQNQIDELEAKVEGINHTETGILATSKAYTDGKIADVNASIEALEGQLGASNTDLEGKINALTGVVESNKTMIETTVEILDRRVEGVEERATELKTRVAELREEDARLAQEIQSVKDVIANQGSDTKVFANMDEFLGAGLSPKVGDLAFVIDIKKAFIYKGEDDAVGFDLPTPPAGWVLFDEISTQIDLIDYLKKEDAEALVAGLDGKIVAETERAQEAEQALNSAIEGLRGVVTDNGAKITALEGTVATHSNEINNLKETTFNQEEVEALIDSAVTAQMSYMGRVEPQGKKAGHVWIETIA